MIDRHNTPSINITELFRRQYCYEMPDGKGCKVGPVGSNNVDIVSVCLNIDYVSQINLNVFSIAADKEVSEHWSLVLLELSQVSTYKDQLKEVFGSGRLKNLKELIIIEHVLKKIS